MTPFWQRRKALLQGAILERLPPCDLPLMDDHDPGQIISKGPESKAHQSRKLQYWPKLVDIYAYRRDIDARPLDRRIDEMRIVAVAAQQLRQFLPADASQHRRIGDLETVDGRTAPSHAGFRNLLECQLVASAPVSASPSPMMQVTIRSGLSKAAP
jgi:hypothetical protein